MKALVLEGLNEPLQLKELSELTPAAGEAIVRVKAAALNHRDVWIQKGQYAGIKYPIILGSDGAGVVAEVGEGVDRSWIGKEVIINPGQNWGSNPNAHAKSFRILGLPDNGTFAQYVKVPAQYLVSKPVYLSFEEAAALPLAGLTAYRALFSRAQLQLGEKVLITGIGGGVALFVLQFALLKRADVYVTSGSDAKIERAIGLGASGGANYRESDWVENLQKKAGSFDVIIDSAAGEGFSKLIELASVGGRIAIYGGTQGKIKDIIPARIFWKQLSILGSTMGNEKEFGNMIKFVEENRLKPVIYKIFNWQDAEEAMRRMDNSEQFGKIVLKME